MGWTNENNKFYEEEKNAQLSKKILRAIILLMVIIIIIVGALIILNSKSSYKIKVDTKEKNISKTDLLLEQNNQIYVNIERFAGLVGYEFHNNEEYKSFIKEQDRCYVKGPEETTTFYIGENNLYKLPVENQTDEYREIKVTDKIIKINEKPFATIEAIQIAFNVVIKDNNKEFLIYTLDSLVNSYDIKMKEAGYESIKGSTFENKKLLLYGYLIVKKPNSLYKIVDLNNTTEIVSDKYNDIQFIEHKEEFIITNSLNKVGIIKLNGDVILEPIYDSVELYDSQEGTYLISESGKKGIVKSGNRVVIPAEFDKIGISKEDYPNEKNKYYILDTLIPVSKDGKWGAYDKTGKKTINIEYDNFGSAKAKKSETAIINTLSNPRVLSIEKCNGIVVEKDNKFGVIDIEGKELIYTVADDIYAKEDKDNSLKYYAFYNGKEEDIIKLLGIKEDGDDDSIQVSL